MDVSDDQCGYRQDKSSIELFARWDWDSEAFVDTEQWDEVSYRTDNFVVCLRDPWTDHDRCVWHAETKNKSAVDFKTLRANGPERLNGAYLADVELDYQFPFAGCSLWGANLSGADLGGADLSRVNLYHADLSRATLFRADLSEANLLEADLPGADLHHADLSEAKLTLADLSEAALIGADLSEATLRSANLSEANLREANLSEADLRSTNLFKIDVYSLQIDDIGDVTVDSRTKVSSRIPLRSGFRHLPILVRGLDIRPWLWDGRARGYERLRRIFQEKGLDDHHRKLYSYQRRARAKEALRTGRFIQWIGNYLSRILTGHGVRITRVLLWTAVVILVPWYWYGLVEGWANESLEGGPFYYSIVTFVTSPPHPIPDTQGSIGLLLTTVDRQSLNQAVVLFQTYVGTVLIILLGYVLGNRDPI